MLPLRHVRRWRIASVLFLLIVLAAALMPAFWFRDDKLSGLNWMDSVDKWLHGITFFALSIWFVGLYRSRSFWCVGVGLLMFGFAIEICQRMVGYRTADIFDVAADAVGIVAGLVLGVAGLGGWCLKIESRLGARSIDAVD